MRNNDNAANRYSYIGEIYSLGEQLKKKQILESMPEKWRKLHEEGYIHIHDLDAYGMTYNCLTFNILEDFPYEKFNGYGQRAVRGNGVRQLRRRSGANIYKDRSAIV